MISALRGRCPSPLDERAMLAGVLGLEPRLSGTRIRRVASYTIPLYLTHAVLAREGILRRGSGSVNPAEGGRRYPAQRARALSIRASVRSLPSNSSDSNKGRETVDPVTATRTA